MFSITRRRTGRLRSWHLLLLLGLLCACANKPAAQKGPSGAGVSAPKPVAPAQAASHPGRPERIIAQNARFVIYLPDTRDTLRSVAQQFLHDEDRAWVIAELNGITEVKAGQPLAVPLQALNPTGVFPNGYQTIPILCYHRFGPEEGKMVVSSKAFAQQMEFLAENGYSVVRLDDLERFLEGRQELPKRSVVITIDDGYASMYQYAFPILKQYRFPATIFVYTDFIGARDALTWNQMQVMVGSGLIDIQAHSKTHSNLTVRFQGESDARYRERIKAEAAAPRDILERRLNVKVSSYAYPYGDANPIVVEELARKKYRIAFTVDPGGNAFFTAPLLLHRTMILGDQNLDTFKARLQVFTSSNLQ